MAAFQSRPAGSLSVRRERTDRVASPFRSEFVTGNYFFETFGIRPSQGDICSEADDRPGGSTGGSTELSGLARALCEAISSVIGSNYWCKAVAFSVIGHRAAGLFRGDAERRSAQTWIPTVTAGTVNPSVDGSLLHQGISAWLRVIGGCGQARRGGRMRQRLTGLLRNGS